MNENFFSFCFMTIKQGVFNRTHRDSEIENFITKLKLSYIFQTHKYICFKLHYIYVITVYIFCLLNFHIIRNYLFIFV